MDRSLAQKGGDGTLYPSSPGKRSCRRPAQGRKGDRRKRHIRVCGNRGTDANRSSARQPARTRSTLVTRNSLLILAKWASQLRFNLPICGKVSSRPLYVRPMGGVTVLPP